MAGRRSSIPGSCAGWFGGRRLTGRLSGATGPRPGPLCSPSKARTARYPSCRRHRTRSDRSLSEIAGPTRVESQKVRDRDGGLMEGRLSELGKFDPLELMRALAERVRGVRVQPKSGGVLRYGPRSNACSCEDGGDVLSPVRPSAVLHKVEVASLWIIRVELLDRSAEQACDDVVFMEDR